MKRRLSIALLLGSGGLLTSVAPAEEGFWPYSAPPAAQVKERYGLELQPAWLERLMKSSARLSSGASGSMVSADGLFLTNFHIGAAVVEQLNTKTKNYLEEGFLAKNPSEELKVPDTTIKIAQSIEDVSTQIDAAVTAGASSEAAAAARRQAISRIEKECTEKDNRRSCQVVSLAEGARYELHRYKEYPDVRLVFCPAQSIAFFHSAAKEPNTDYLDAFNLDICLFRVYENGVPARLSHYLKWARAPVREGDLAFASGFPHSTERQQSMARLRYRRDVELLGLVTTQQRLISTLSDLISRSDEAPQGVESALRTARSQLTRLQTELTLLQDPVWLRQMQTAEDAFKALLAEKGEQTAIDAYTRQSDAFRLLQSQSSHDALIEDNPLLGSMSYYYANELLVAAQEITKPEAEREERYRQPMWGMVVAWLSGKDFDPFYKEVEQAQLAAWLHRLAETLHPDDRLVQEILAGESPDAAAARIMGASRIGDPEFHKTLLSGDDRAIAAAIARTEDSMIVLVRLLKAEASSLMEVQEAMKLADVAETDIARARYQTLSGNEYPEATNTLRLSYGTVQGYELGGRTLTATSTFGDFNRWADAHPREREKLPESWATARSRLNPATPFNFAATFDIASGNSGSPVVNRAGEFVGVAAAYAPTQVPPITFSPVRSRVISIAGPALVESLRKVYGANALATELLAGRR